MTTLAIDIETYCNIDLRDSGVYPYAVDASFRILLFAYAFDDEPVQIVDLACGERIPRRVLDALRDPNVIKTAWNAQFERVCLEAECGFALPASEWRCTMVHAYYLGLPGRLDTAAKSLNLPIEKDTRGATLIRYFSKPCKPTKTNGGRTRNLPEHDPLKWAQFREYCIRDVEVERAIRKKLERVPVPDHEWRLWALDQEINDRGIRIDRELVAQAIKADEERRDSLLLEAEILTGLDNPNSVEQLKNWLREAEGMEVESLNKKVVPELIKQAESSVTERVLEIRQQLAKTSVKKYQAMERAVCNDGRVRGLLQFYGANRTGRWAGRIVQVQNLPRNTMRGLATARSLLRSGHADALNLLFDDELPFILSQLIRTAFVPEPGHSFLVADFSAIEARVVAWLAGEKWRLDVFNDHGRIYEASAAQMFGLRIEDVDKELRQKGKIAELALGYQGSKGALIQMGALDMGLSEEELPGLVDAWRAANPSIVELWSAVNEAAIATVRDQKPTALYQCPDVCFELRSGILFAHLPSGRSLCYVRPRIEPDPKFGWDGLTYEGNEDGRWARVRTYGGKLVENLTQAIARDCLAVALERLEAAGYNIAFHVHDEVVLEMPNVPHETLGLHHVSEVMSQPIDWAPGLPLRAEAFECEFYRKED